MSSDINYVKKYKFSNGYGASVVCREQSFGFKKGLFEVAVLYKGRIVYDTPITDDVVTDCDHATVARVLEDIMELPAKPACGVPEDVRNHLIHDLDY